MYSFFELAGTQGAKLAALGSAMILSAVLFATAIVPASPATPLFAGVMA